MQLRYFPVTSHGLREYKHLVQCMSFSMYAVFYCFCILWWQPDSMWQTERNFTFWTVCNWKVISGNKDSKGRIYSQVRCRNMCTWLGHRHHDTTDHVTSKLLLTQCVQSKRWNSPLDSWFNALIIETLQKGKSSDSWLSKNMLIIILNKGYCSLVLTLVTERDHYCSLLYFKVQRAVRWML